MLGFDEVRRIALECKPKMIIAGASAYARTLIRQFSQAFSCIYDKWYSSWNSCCYYQRF